MVNGEEFLRALGHEGFVRGATGVGGGREAPQRSMRLRGRLLSPCCRPSAAKDDPMTARCPLATLLVGLVPVFTVWGLFVLEGLALCSCLVVLPRIFLRLLPHCLLALTGGLITHPFAHKI